MQMDKYVLVSKSVKRNAAFCYIMVDWCRWKIRVLFCTTAL